MIKLGFVKLVALIALSAGTLFMYQNCGEGFKSSAELGSVDPASLDRPTIIMSTTPGLVSNVRRPSFGFQVTANRFATISAVTCSLDSAVAVNCLTGFSATSDLADGDHTLNVTATDNLGNSAQESYLWKVDATNPAVTVGADECGAFNEACYTIAATDVGGAGVARVECKLTRNGVATAFEACPAGVRKEYRALTDGSYVFAAQAFDAAGNLGVAANVSFTVTTPTAPVPSVTITGPTGTVFSSNSISVTFTGVNAVSFICSLDNANSAGATACTSPWATPGVLTEAAHTVRVWARAADGTLSTPAAKDFTVDRSGPAVPVITSNVGTAGSYTRLTSATFNFTSAGSTRFECRLVRTGTTAPAFATCTSGQSFALATEGAHSMEVQALDGAGNRSASGSFAFTVDRTAPVITITGSNGSFTIAVTETSPITAQRCQVMSGTTVVRAFATCGASISYTGLAVGTYVMRVEVVDSAQNSATRDSSSWTVTTVPTTYTAGVSWDPNTEASVTGYNVYYGTSMTAMTTRVNAGKPATVSGRVNFQLTGLTRGTRYYFAVTAYDPTTESDRSQIVEFTPPL